MLNRRLSEYLFYGSLALITIGILIIRYFLIGNLTDQIETTDRQNIALQKQIDALEEVVQENKQVQTSHLYELYDIIPNVYSGTELTYKTVSILESLGVNESNDMQRTVYVDHEPSFADGSIFTELNQDYYVVEVQVYFTTQDIDVVNNLVDELYNNDQLFIIRALDYAVPEEDDFITVSVNFLAIYDIDEEIEEES